MDIYYNILPVNVDIHKETFIKHKSIYVFILVNTEQNELYNHNWAYIFRQKLLYDNKGEMGAQKTFYGEHNDSNVLFYTFRKFSAYGNFYRNYMSAACCSLSEKLVAPIWSIPTPSHPLNSEG